MTIYQPTIQLKEFTDENGVKYEDTFLDESGNISFIYDVDSVSQTVKNAISLWLGEYQFDTTLGINWLTVLGQTPNRTILTSAIQKAVLSVPYVSSIVSIDFVNFNSERIEAVSVKYLNTDSKVNTTYVNL